MGVQRAGAPYDLLVGRMPAGKVDSDRDRFVAFVGDDDALADLGGVGVALGRGRAGSGRALLCLGRSSLGAPFGGLLLAPGNTGGGPVLGTERRLRLAR